MVLFFPLAARGSAQTNTQILASAKPAYMCVFACAFSGTKNAASIERLGRFTVSGGTILESNLPAN